MIKLMEAYDPAQIATPRKKPTLGDFWRRVDDKKRRPHVNQPVWMQYKVGKQVGYALMCWSGNAWTNYAPINDMPDGAVLVKYIVLPT